MTRYLSLAEIVRLHERLIETTGGSHGIRDIHGLESVVGQPRMTFAENELYPDVTSKAVALCYSLVLNHPFVDGNKRVGHAAMEVFLVLNGYEIDATTDDQEALILDLAASQLSREAFSRWLKEHITEHST